MILRFYCKLSDGSEKIFTNSLGFTFVKEAFTPYTTLNARISGLNFPEDIQEIKLYIDGRYVHHGIVDTYRLSRSNGVDKLTISSRGYTALLTENQLPPALYTDMTFNRLFDEYFQLPNITHENNSETSYIYVNKGTPMWDGAANLCWKLKGSYPYIRGTNKVMMSMPDDAVTRTYLPESYMDCGTEVNTRLMVSHYNMADIDGSYGTFSAESQEAIDRNIIRHRHFELDKRFLYEPASACDYRIMMAERNYKRRYITVVGYNGEDINDILNCEGYENRRIKGVRISGSGKGIFTKISF